MMTLTRNTRNIKDDNDDSENNNRNSDKIFVLKNVIALYQCIITELGIHIFKVGAFYGKDCPTVIPQHIVFSSI